MKQILVEREGYEYSLYGGDDGHYCGTNTTDNAIMDVTELPEKLDNVLIVKFGNFRDGSEYITISETRDYLYWAPEFYEVICEPKTHNSGIRTNVNLLRKIYLKEVAAEKMTLEMLRSEEYFTFIRKYKYEGVTLGEFKKILKSL